ncbi:MAG: DinB family protein [Pseudomonadota bacterium]
MTLVNHIRREAANNLWSNHRLARAWLRLTAGEFEAPRTNFFPSIKETVQHILEVDLYYLDALEQGGEGQAIFRRPLPSAQDRLAADQQAADRRLLAFCEALAERDLSEIRTLERKDGDKPEEIQAILAHLFQHQIHHRGQIHAMLAGTDIPPPQLDEFFLRQDLPLRADEMQALDLDLGA